MVAAQGVEFDFSFFFGTLHALAADFVLLNGQSMAEIPQTA